MNTVTSTASIHTAQTPEFIKIAKKVPQFVGEKVKTILTNPICNAWNVGQAAGGGLITLGVGSLVLPTAILAAAGSIAPGVGTAVGAALGGSIGTAVGVSLIAAGVAIWTASTIAGTAQDVILNSKTGDSIPHFLKTLLLQSAKNIAWGCGAAAIGSAGTVIALTACVFPLVGAAMAFAVPIAIAGTKYAYNFYCKMDKLVKTDEQILESNKQKEKLENINKNLEKVLSKLPSGASNNIHQLTATTQPLPQDKSISNLKKEKEDLQGLFNKQQEKMDKLQEKMDKQQEYLEKITNLLMQKK